MLRITNIFVLLAFFCGLFSALAADEDYADTLVAEALAQDLDDDPYWHLLLHYQPGRLWGVKSLVDDPVFFNAPDGKTNPTAELKATLRAFFQPYEEASEREHAICRFPARFRWLDETLSFDRTELPSDTCAAFDQAYTFLAPTSVALIFPSAYMGGPGSMFGHTLLVFDSEGKSRLLSRAVNYAAETPETFGPLFSIMGLAGFYKGYYQILPYYDKVEQYSDLTHRDMWEYELSLTKDEVARVFAHTWELQSTFSYYYFLNENCAYNLLYLLEAGRPALDLTDHFRVLAIPIDTVKLIKDRGIIANTMYRPSKATRILAMAEGLPDADRDLALSVSRGDAEPAVLVADAADNETKIRRLDLAAEYAQYLYTEQVTSPEAYRKRVLPILKERSALGQVPEDFYSYEEPTHPEDGHKGSLVVLGGGVQDGDGYYSLGYRFSYHGLIDNNVGFEPGAHLQFFNLDARYYSARNGAELQRLDVVDVISLVPRDDFFKSSSWKVSTGLVQEKFKREQDHLAWQANYGSGVSYNAGWLGRLFAMWDADLRIGSAYESDFAYGLGVHAGQVMEVNDAFHVVTSVKQGYRFSPNDYWVTEVDCSATLRISQNLSVTLEVEQNQVGSFSSHDVKGALRIYY